jgi:hypothetical protein
MRQEMGSDWSKMKLENRSPNKNRNQKWEIYCVCLLKQALAEHWFRIVTLHPLYCKSLVTQTKDLKPLPPPQPPIFHFGKTTGIRTKQTNKKHNNAFVVIQNTNVRPLSSIAGSGWQEEVTCGNWTEH